MSHTAHAPQPHASPAGNAQTRVAEPAPTDTTCQPTAEATPPPHHTPCPSTPGTLSGIPVHPDDITAPRPRKALTGRGPR